MSLDLVSGSTLQWLAWQHWLLTYYCCVCVRSAGGHT